MIGNKSISLCYVSHNDSELLEKSRQSVLDIINETVVVDQGSNAENSKRLKSLADIYIYTTPKGNGDYDRQFCYSLAQKDFILAMDSDEMIEPEEIEKLKSCVQKFDFDIMWFLFKNLVTFEDKTLDIQDMLGDDPHPRLWRTKLNVNGQVVPTLIWGQEAHTFPQLNSQNQVYSNVKFTHHRQLENIIKTHLRRGKNISPQAKQMEVKFVDTLLSKFGSDVKKKMIIKFTELSDYLRNK